MSRRKRSPKPSSEQMARFVDPHDESVMVLREGRMVALDLGGILDRVRTMMERIEMTPGAPVALEAVITPETIVDLISAGLAPGLIEHMAVVAAEVVARRYPDFGPGVFNWDLREVDPFEHVQVSTPDPQRYAQLGLAQQILTDALNAHPPRVPERTRGLDPFAIISVLHSMLLMYVLVVTGLAARGQDTETDR